MKTGAASNVSQEKVEKIKNIEKEETFIAFWEDVLNLWDVHFKKTNLHLFYRTLLFPFNNCPINILIRLIEF